ncbi:hypothetical protein CBS101457_006505 [Exobasidium rhododendri]|nr:hypothetical protein CBS101457_006505 [Exobasidium rhododendri]
MASSQASSSRLPATTPSDSNTRHAVASPTVDLAADASTSSSFSWLPSDLLASNPYFSAGFGLMVFGTAIAIGRRGVTMLASQTQRRFLISLEIPSKDKAHPWFLQWMGAQAKAQAMRNLGLLPTQKESLREFIGLGGDGQGKGKGLEKEEEVWENDPLKSGSTRASPIRIFSHELSVETSTSDMKSRLEQQQQSSSTSRGDARFSLVPGPGTHWFRYKNCWMKLTRERNGRMLDLTTGAPWETVTLTTLRSHAHLFTSLLAEARQLAVSSTEGKTIIYTAWGAEWRPFGQPRRARELSSVILGKGKRQAIEADVRRFMQRGWWYAERGIPYRRGYLLHGSPGSGKSSFIFALAGSLDLSICLLNLSERGLTDDKLNHLLSNAPERCILLLEDVDAAFLGRNKAADSDGYQANVTFSGLLNSLDGVASSESRIIFMTTNHVERLDEALIRPGRVDSIEELGDAEKEQVEELLLRFYDQKRTGEKITPTLEEAQREEGTANVKDDDLRRLAVELANAVEVEAIRRRRACGLDDEGRIALDKTGDGFKSVRSASAVRPRPAARGGVSMAELQGLFIRYPDDPKLAVAAFKKQL